MSKPIHDPSAPTPTWGFTLIELMVALSVSLLVFGLAFTLLQQLDNTADLVGSTSDVNENLRAALNMVSRDISIAGQNIPLNGIPLPYGGTATAINRPYPSGYTYTPAPAATTLFMPVLTAGNAKGPTQGSGTTAINTDAVTIIGVNQTSLFNQTAVNVTANPPTIAASAATITTVSPAAAGYVSPGQLIMLTDLNSSCLLAVSSVNANTGVITFKSPDSTNDVLGVNQFPTLSGNGTISSGPTSGTILQLETATTNNGVTTYTWPQILTAYPISMVTYYLDNSNPRRLMKQNLMATAQPVALGINVMQIFYSLSPPATLNGVTSDPTENPWPTTADPQNSPNNIRKVVVTMIGETDHPNYGSRQWYSRSITNAVSVQNLDYSNKYNLGAKMTQN